MKQNLHNLWLDDAGALIATEWLFCSSILVLGAVTGLVAVRNMINHQLEDTAAAIGSLDPSYDVRGMANRESATAGSAFIENRIDIHGPLVGPTQLRRSPPSPVWGDDAFPAD